MSAVGQTEKNYIQDISSGFRPKPDIRRPSEREFVDLLRLFCFPRISAIT